VEQPPQLLPIEIRPSGNGAYVARLAGKDLDWPTGRVTYSLKMTPEPIRAPMLSAQSGQFGWRPAPDDLGKTFHITFRVAKESQLELFSEQTVKVEVPAEPGASEPAP
jgi:hypothetical protein